MNTNQQQQNTLVFFPSLATRVGLTKSTIYRYWADPDSTFPKPRKIGLKRVGILESELNEWIANAPSARAKEGSAS